MNDLIINHIAELILPRSTDKPLKGKELDKLNVVKNGTVVIKDGKIVDAGQHTDDYDPTVPSISRCTYPFNIWWISRT